MINLTTEGGLAAPGSFVLKYVDFETVSNGTLDNFLPDGPYIGKVTGANANVKSTRAELLFDVAGGEYKDYYRKHPRAPDYLHVIYLNADETSLVNLKYSLKIFAGYNQGFDPFASWNRDLREFIGKLFGFTAYRKEIKGDCGTRTMPRYRLVPATDLANGSYSIPGDVHADGTREPAKSGFPIDLGDYIKEPGGAFDDLLGDADA